VILFYWLEMAYHAVYFFTLSAAFTDVYFTEREAEFSGYQVSLQVGFSAQESTSRYQPLASGLQLNCCWFCVVSLGSPARRAQNKLKETAGFVRGTINLILTQAARQKINNFLVMPG
jgi:hypothetical protein